MTTQLPWWRRQGHRGRRGVSRQAETPIPSRIAVAVPTIKKGDLASRSARSSHSLSVVAKSALLICAMSPERTCANSWSRNAPQVAAAYR